MEKISAWMDGELGREQCAQLVRQSASPDCQAAWASYHLIGEALRGELDPTNCAVGTNSELTRRICAALADEPNILVPSVARAGREHAHEPSRPLVDHLGNVAGAVSGSGGSGAASAGEYVKVGNGGFVWKPWLMAASVATAAVVGWQAATADWRRAGSAEQLAARQAAPAVSGAGTGAGQISATSAVISYDRYLQAHDEVASISRLSGARAYTQPVSYAVTH